MELEEEALAEWERQLRLAEEDLRERERQALAGDPSPAELLALAAEHDEIALDRDSLADSYDARATARDHDGLGRDVAGSSRDRQARVARQDRDPAFADRWLAGEDRDYAAGDRSDSHDDRRRGAVVRERGAAERIRAADRRERAQDEAAEQGRELDGLRTALECRLVIGQAQGLLMARHELSADAAFSVLVRMSQHANTRLRVIAAELVAAAESDRKSASFEGARSGPPR